MGQFPFKEGHMGTLTLPLLGLSSPFPCVSRVPDDSDSQSGVIRQRQNCLESRLVEGQELPVLTLGPCIGKEGVPAINQVRDFTHCKPSDSQMIIAAHFILSFRDIPVVSMSRPVLNRVPLLVLRSLKVHRGTEELYGFVLYSIQYVPKGAVAVSVASKEEQNFRKVSQRLKKAVGPSDRESQKYST